MYILNARQIHQWDAFTIEHQKISSLDLMERAVTKCLEWLEQQDCLQKEFAIYCGKGNNGGDGLALARLLAEKKCIVTVYILELEQKASDDFQSNLSRLKEHDVAISFIRSAHDLKKIPPKTLIVDALFGSGLNRSPDDTTAALIKYLNGEWQ